MGRWSDADLGLIDLILLVYMADVIIIDKLETGARLGHARLGAQI